MPGTSPGMTGEWSGLARPRASWMPGYPEQVRASPAMTLVSPRAQGARCGNIGRALGSFSNGMLPRGIPLIPLNPGESRFTINLWRNPAHAPTRVMRRFSFRPSRHRRLWPVVPEEDATARVRASTPWRDGDGRVDARIPGTSPGMSAHDGGVAGLARPRAAWMPGYPERVRASPGMTGEWSGLARPRASWMPGYPERVRACPGMTV